MKKLFLLISFISFALIGFSQTTLSPGDIAIFGVNADTPDNFGFVLLVDIEAGTEIRFTDSGWESDNTFRPNEGCVKYTAPSALNAGTEINFITDAADFAPDGDADVGTNSLSLSTSGDQVFAFQGLSTSPTFIYAVQTNSNTWQATATGSSDSGLPQGLTDGVNAVAVGSGAGSGDEYDNAAYDKSTMSGTASEILAAVSTNTNWLGDDANLYDLTTYDFTVSAPPPPPTLPNAWINEIHYDNDGGDVDEMVEIVIENPGDWTLSNFKVELYKKGTVAGTAETYDSETLDNFSSDDTEVDFQFYTWEPNLINNLKAGLSLSYDGTVIQFLGYEGSLTAVDGDANGLTSTDIGVSEPNTTPIGLSLQLSGFGQAYDDFTWEDPATATSGSLNNAQAFYPPPSPVLDPAGGTYYTAQDVTISLPAGKNGYDFYYNINSVDDPDINSTPYTGPITVDQIGETTIKAVYFDGNFYSEVTTETYTLVETTPIATVADLRAAYNNKVATFYELTGEVFLTYQRDTRNQKYVQDATAGILIDDNSGIITTTYARYDGITGLIGTLSAYNGVLQFIPVADPGAATSTANTVDPIELSVEDFNAERETYESMLVTVMASSFDENLAGTNFASSTNYTITDNDGFDAIFRTSFWEANYIGQPIPAGNKDITGLLTEYNGTAQLVAREMADFAVSDTPAIPLGSAGIILAGLLMAAVLVVRKGRLF